MLDDQPPAAPTRRAPDADSVRSRLAEAGLVVPEACIAGTRANLATLDAHADTVRSFGLDPRSASALRFRP